MNKSAVHEELTGSLQLPPRTEEAEMPEEAVGKSHCRKRILSEQRKLMATALQDHQAQRSHVTSRRGHAAKSVTWALRPEV